MPLCDQNNLSPGDGWDNYTSMIIYGLPVVVAFSGWSVNEVLDREVQFLDPVTGELIDELVVFLEWDEGSSQEPQNEGIGHCVTGVGFCEDFDPDGEEGPLPQADWAIVHDTSTEFPTNVAVAWEDWRSEGNPSYWLANIIGVVVPIPPPQFPPWDFQGNTPVAAMELVDSEYDEDRTETEWGRIDYNGDEDWFCFRLPDSWRPDWVQITLECLWRDSKVWPEIEVYSTKGDLPIMKLAATGEGEDIIMPCPVDIFPSEAYYIRVTDVRGQGSPKHEYLIYVEYLR